YRIRLLRAHRRSSAQAAMDRLVPSRCATRLAALQRSLRDVGIAFDGEVSWRSSRKWSGTMIRGQAFPLPRWATTRQRPRTGAEICGAQDHRLAFPELALRNARLCVARYSLGNSKQNS